MNGEGDLRATDDVIRWLEAAAPDLVDDATRLRRLLLLLDRYQHERWHRHVSAGDAITDRWERASRLGFGEGTSVYDSALIIGDVQVGTNTWIGPNTVLDGAGGLVIGDWCSISAGAQIYSHDSVVRALSSGAVAVERTPTAIGSNTYVGPNTVIGKGVIVGRRCVVGAASLVLEDVPDGTVVYGAPARVVQDVEDFLRHRTTETPDEVPEP